MRTTLQLEPDVYEAARLISFRRKQSLGKVVSDLVREALANSPQPSLGTQPNGLPKLHYGRKITQAEVAELLDDES